MSVLNAQQNEVLSFIKEFSSSNFFSTQPQSKTSQSFYPLPDNLTLKTNIMKKRPLSQSLHLQKLNISHSLQQLQQLSKQSPLQKMKTCRQKLTQTKQIFSNEQQLTHRKQQTYDKMVHCTNILKTRFINLYETKKHQLNCERIMIKGKMERDEQMRRSCDEIRMKKRQREEGLAEGRVKVGIVREGVRRMIEQDKEYTKMRLNKTMSKQQQWRLSLTNTALEDANRFTIRKQQLDKLKRMRSRFNYQVKMKEQQQLINEYEIILRKMEQGGPESTKDWKLGSLMSERSSIKRDDASTVEGGMFVTQVSCCSKRKR